MLNPCPRRAVARRSLIALAVIVLGGPAALAQAPAPAAGGLDLRPPRYAAAGEHVWPMLLPVLLEKLAPDHPAGYLLQGYDLRQKARAKRTVAGRMALLQQAVERFRRATERLEKAKALPPDLMLCYAAWAEATLELARLVDTPHIKRALLEDALDVERKLGLVANPDAGGGAVLGYVTEVIAVLSDRPSQPRQFERAKAAFDAALKGPLARQGV